MFVRPIPFRQMLPSCKLLHGNVGKSFPLKVAAQGVRQLREHRSCVFQVHTFERTAADNCFLSILAQRKHLEFS